MKRLRRAAVVAAVAVFIGGSRVADWFRWPTTPHPTEHLAWTERDQDAYDEHYRKAQR